MRLFLKIFEISSKIFLFRNIKNFLYVKSKIISSDTSYWPQKWQKRWFLVSEGLKISLKLNTLLQLINYFIMRFPVKTGKNFGFFEFLRLVVFLGFNNIIDLKKNLPAKWNAFGATEFWEKPFNYQYLACHLWSLEFI